MPGGLLPPGIFLLRGMLMLANAIWAGRQIKREEN